MDKGKPFNKPSMKGKAPGFAGDFIPLGSKAGPSSSRSSNLDSAPSADSKRGSSNTSGSSKSSSFSSSSSSKRDLSSSQATLPAGPKKFKDIKGLPLPKPSSSSSVPKLLPQEKKTETAASNRTEAWEEFATEVDFLELTTNLVEAEEADDEERIEALLCGAVRQLKAQRTKIDATLVLTLLYTAKSRPTFFFTEYIVEALSSLLKRENATAPGMKIRANGTILAVLGANLLMAAYQDEKAWPEAFLKAYIEDALGERVWVDREDCQGFVNNILTAFGTRLPPRHMFADMNASTTIARPEPGSSPSLSSSLAGTPEEDMDTDNVVQKAFSMQSDVPVYPRYTALQESVEQFVLDVIKEQIARRQQPDSATRNLLKFLAATCGIGEVRLMSSQRLEMWLMNPKITRAAHELFLSICLNCSSNAFDTEVISTLVKVRSKTKPAINVYLSCFKELVEAFPDHLYTVMKHTIYNELSTSRNPNNMALLTVLFQNWTERAPSVMADVFMELLLNRDDFLRALRALLREIVRSLRFEINLRSFCAGLLKPRDVPDSPQTAHLNWQALQDFEFKDRLLLSMADLVTLAVFLGITPTVRDSATRADTRMAESLKNYQLQVATIQRDAVSWLFLIVPKQFRPSKTDYTHCLHKILLMEQPEQYWNKDGWPPEVDRSIFLRLAAEVPVLDDTLYQILRMGLSKEHPILPADAVELGDYLLRRAAALLHSGYPVLQTDKLHFIDVLFNLSAYHHPESISLPADYAPPKLAIAHLYWKAWAMLLVLTAHNPTVYGELVWNSYPSLRALMEMCITNQFVFPPATFAASGKAGDLKLQEQQISALEKQTILEFEAHLAAASSKVPITEANSLLLSQLTSLDPLGPARKPSQAVLDQLRALNSSLKLGHLLCRSRQPDFLLDIIQRQGPEQSMPWLADLVESSDNAYCMLPVQCLCEFLLRQMVDDIPITDMEDVGTSAVKVSKKREKKQKQQVLLQYLQSLLSDGQQDEQTPREILDYFLRRLSSPNRIGRQQAIKVLQLLLNQVCGETETETKEESAFQWLITGLPALPHFGALHHTIVQALRQSLQVESLPEAVAAYLKYLSMYTAEDSIQELSELALDLAQLIVERSSLMASLLPSPNLVELPLSSTYLEAFRAFLTLFGTYMCKIRQLHKEAYSWSENQDQIFIQWPTGETATMHILVVHAIIILLTSGPIQPSTVSEVQTTAAMYQELLEMWFSERQGPPSAYLVDTSEEALLFPDWLKLRMIRSSVPNLVDAALKDLEPAQLILFIQSFGIPVPSMSKLLRTLDAAVQANPFAFVEVDMDKAYMAQLLNVQWARGAHGGSEFADLMQLEEPPLPSPPAPSFVSTSAPKLPIPAPNLHEKSGLLKPEQAESVLKRLFDVGTVIRLSQQEKQDILRSLLKALSMEMSQKTEKKPLVAALAASLVQLATGGVESGAFLAGLDRQPTLSSAILRLLTTFAKRQEGGDLKAHLHRFFTVLDSSSLIRQRVLRQLTSSFLNLGPRNVASGKEEAKLVKLTGEALQSQKIPTECAPGTLFENLVTAKGQTTPQGLTVDWLQVLDPELGTIQPEKLLQKEVSDDSQVVSSRPYLMALITHQTKWSTLWNFISNMLEPQKIGNYDATMALNFLRACTQIPKLWQGRDKHVPKHSQIEVLFHFHKKQLHALVELMAMEYTQNAHRNDQNYATRILRDRLLLLLQCSQSRQQDIQVAQWLYEKAQKNPGCAHAAILTQLYMRRPHIALHLSSSSWQPVEVPDLPSEVDAFAHAMLSSLAALQPGRDGNRRLMDLDMAFRKLAATHPSLVVRQLGLLASYLRGRAHYEWNVLKSRNEFSFFSCSLGFLEILMPYCFQAQHRSALLDALESYFELVKNHGSVRDMSDVIRRLHCVVDNALAYDPSMSVFFQKHAQMLSALASSNADLRNLQVLCSSVTRAAHQKTTQSHTSLAWIQTPKGRKTNVGPLLLRLRHSDSTEEMEQVLNDLDLATADCPWVLEKVWDDVRAFLTSPAPAVRRLSFVLALRLLHTKPRKAPDLFPDMLSCLSHIDMAIVSTALEKLPELCLLAQEFAPALFARVFELASEVNVDVVPFLVDAASVLQHQCGV